MYVYLTTDSGIGNQKGKHWNRENTSCPSSPSSTLLQGLHWAMAFQDAGETVHVDTASLLLVVVTIFPIHTDLFDSLISAFSSLRWGGGGQECLA